MVKLEILNTVREKVNVLIVQPNNELKEDDFVVKCVSSIPDYMDKDINVLERKKYEKKKNSGWQVIEKVQPADLVVLVGNWYKDPICFNEFNIARLYKKRMYFINEV